MTIHPDPKPPKREKRQRKEIAKLSAKTLAERGGKPGYSTFKKSAPDFTAGGRDEKKCGNRLNGSGGKKIRSVNPGAEARRRARYRVKLAGYKRSETYTAVEKRAGGCCEARFTFDGMPARCGNNRANGFRLTHHHKTYARFGGKELPEDIIVLCDWHNAEAEAAHPTRNRNYSAHCARMGLSTENNS